MSDVANSFPIVDVFCSDAPSPDDLAVVANGLDEFNLQQAGVRVFLTKAL